jgi:hypothetical protein
VGFALAARRGDDLCYHARRLVWAYFVVVRGRGEGGGDRLDQCSWLGVSGESSRQGRAQQGWVLCLLACRRCNSRRFAVPMDDVNSFLESVSASGCSILTLYFLPDTRERQTTTGRLLSLGQGSGKVSVRTQYCRVQRSRSLGGTLFAVLTRGSTI